MALAEVRNNDLSWYDLPSCTAKVESEEDTRGREVLGALYGATGGANWTNNTNWHSDAPIGEWHGVTTDNDGRVTALSLEENNLSGELPAALGDLAHLKVLYLPGNQLQGEIPAALGDLPNLSVLNLVANRLSGELPSALGNLSGLTTLNLAENELRGAIPAALGNLSALTTLNLSSNQLSEVIPATLGNLTRFGRSQSLKQRIDRRDTGGSWQPFRVSAGWISQRIA